MTAFRHETGDGTLYIVPARRLWFRWLLLHRLCEHLGHRWEVWLPPHPRIRSRTGSQCRRCGLLRWKWEA